VFVVELNARQFGPEFFLFAVSVAYLPALLFGQLVWAVWRERLPWWQAGLLGLAAWLLYAWEGSLDLGRAGSSYNSTLALGLLLFIVLLLNESRLRPNRIVGYLADRSYSMYLLHAFALFPVLQVLWGTVPAPLAVLDALVAVWVAMELGHRLVERPCQRLVRRMLPGSRG
jgi:peptidoglycan/LPS O-acetylase OafA/YrhL